MTTGPHHEHHVDDYQPGRFPGLAMSDAALAWVIPTGLAMLFCPWWAGVIWLVVVALVEAYARIMLADRYGDGWS